MNPAQQQQYNQALTDSQRAGMFDPTGNLMSLAGQSASVDSRALSRSEEHTSELQSHSDLVCRLLLEKKQTLMPLSQRITSL